MHHDRRFTRIPYILAMLALLASFAPPASALPAQPSTNSAVGLFSLLKYIPTANRSSFPANFFDISGAAGSRFLFTARGDYFEQALVSDGTAAGTQELSSFNYQLYNVIPGPFTAYNGKAYFTAMQGDRFVGMTLWETDGTKAGTSYVYGFPADSTATGEKLVYDGWLFFTVIGFDYQGGYLWRTQGAGRDTSQVVETPVGSGGAADMAVSQNALYFASNETTGPVLWRLTSAEAAPEQVKQICAAPCGPGPHGLTSAGNRLFFVAYDATYGSELWVSDASGTRVVKDIFPNPPGSPGPDDPEPYSLTAVGDLLYFIADDGVQGQNLWVTDGSAQGTRRIPGAGSPTAMTVMNGALYYGADDGQHGSELWKIAAPQAAPVLIDILPGPAGSVPTWLTVVGNWLYFVAGDTPGNRELWRTGGTPAAGTPTGGTPTGGTPETTALVADIVPGPSGSWPEALAAWGNKLVFSAVDEIHNREPWISDGTAGGTHLLADLQTGINTDPSFWTAGGTRRPSNLEAGAAEPSYWAPVSTYGDFTYFTLAGPDRLHGTWYPQLWRTDGTSQGTLLVKDFTPGTVKWYSPLDQAEMDGVVYFAEPWGGDYWDTRPRDYSDGYGSELWRTDGTPAGTWRVKDIRPGLLSSQPATFTRAGTRVFFFANDGQGKALWQTDGSPGGTTRVSGTIPWPDIDYLPYPDSAAALGSNLIFIAGKVGSPATMQLWRSDGTANGTRAYYSLPTPVYNHGPMIPFDGRAFFGLGQKDGSTRLFATNGKASGTSEISTPGVPASYDLGEMVVYQGNLYFTTLWPHDTGYPAPHTTGLWKLAPGSSTAKQLTYSTSSRIDMLTGFADKGIAFRKNAQWWISDGTRTHTHAICPTCDYGVADDMRAVSQGNLYFMGGSISEGSSLWVTDGTASGTHSLAPDVLTSGLLSIDRIAPSNYGLVVFGSDAAQGRGVWLYALGTSTFLPVVER